MKRSLFAIIFIACTIPCAAQWRNIGAGELTGTEVGTDQAFGVHDSSLFVGYGGHGIWRYRSGTWTVVNTGLDLTQGNITSFASLGGYLFAAANNGAAYLSSDDGSHWTLTAGGPVASNGKYVFSGEGGYGIYRSRDSGAIWDSINRFSVNSFGTIGACIFASTDSGLYRSTDSGTNWVKTVTPPALSLSAFAVIDTQIFAGGTGVFRSTDSGQHWTQISLANCTVNALDTSRGYLFAGTDTGVFVSSDSGINWKNVSQGMGSGLLKAPDVTLLAVLDTMLFAEVYAGTDGNNNQYGYATARPISEMTKDTTSAVQEISQPGDSLAVYPNPLTNSATIVYSISEDSRVTITIYDALGRTISNPVAGEETSGNHEITFDAQPLPSGIYWCHFTAGSVERSVKLVISH